MTRITITPNTFSMVNFSTDAIAKIADRVCANLNLSGVDQVRIDIDETSPLARGFITSLEPLTLRVEGGAFEDTRKPRELSEARTADTIGRYLLKATDRLGDSFGDAPAEDDLTLAQSAAWDVHCVGRLVRHGQEGQRKRRLYQFRNRHGFTDAADAAFDELWNSTDLTWSDVNRISAAAIEASALADPTD